MGVTTSGEREILGTWAGGRGKGARFWLQVFSELEYDVEIRQVIRTMNTTESINARYRRAVRGLRALSERGRCPEMPVSGYQVP